MALKIEVKMEGAHAGFFTQLMALTKREAQNVWRDKAGLIASVMVPLVLNVPWVPTVVKSRAVACPKM